MPLEAARPVVAPPHPESDTVGLVDIGPRREWLFSRHLCPMDGDVDAAIEELVRAKVPHGGLPEAIMRALFVQHHLGHRPSSGTFSSTRM